jgi:DedD protein
VPVAWILQVASVSSREKANALRDTLLAADHKAYVKQIRSGDRTLYRVYIGPKFEKAQLERIKPSIDGAHGVSSLIVRYVP